jgi:formylglycine-generating enzyme required for sulfatase activity
MLRFQNISLAALLAALLLPQFAYAQDDAEEKAIIRERIAAGQRFDGGKKWAVVIGVNDYVDERISDLRCCVDDAKLVAKTLSEKCGYPVENILTITDDQSRAHLRPLRAGLQQQVSAWLKFAGEEDTVMVFFSGHGFLDDRGQGFLATQDARMDYLGLTALRTDELRDMLRQCKAGQKVLVLDCCHAGAEKDLSTDAPSSEELGSAFRDARGLVTLASCGRDEKSREWDEKGHGLFTYYLAEGLQGKADRDRDGIVTSDELYLYTHSHVQTSARRLFGQAQQPRRIIGEDVVGVFALARLSGPAQAIDEKTNAPIAPPQVIKPRIEVPDASGPVSNTAANAASVEPPRVPATFTVRSGGADGDLLQGASVDLWFRASADARLQLLAHGVTGVDGKARLSLTAQQASLRGQFAVMAGRGDMEKVWDLPEFPRLRNYNLVLVRGEIARGEGTHDDPVINSIGMKFIRLTGPEIGFANAAEGHEELADAHAEHTHELFFGQFEVTIGEFRQFVKATGYKTEAERGDGGAGWNESAERFEAQNRSYNWKHTGFEQDDSHPVVNITWNDANAFCQWLSKVEGRTYRLPTESEWEFACRGGTTSRWSCGDKADELALIGNIADGSAKTKFASWEGIEAHDGYVFTSSGGCFQPNAFGLYDMHGNVWEWCADSFQAKEVRHEHRHSLTGGCSLHRDCLTHTKSVQYNALRGGSWLSIADGADSGYRNWNSPGLRSVDLGFRVVIEP